MASTSDLTNIMELSLPSSTNSSRPGTPTVTNCERLTAIKKDIEKFGIVIEATKSTIKTLLFAGVTDDNDPTLLHYNRRLDEIQMLQQLAVSEFTSQPYCNTPGCTVHHIPNSFPVKNNNKNQEPIKTTAMKRKENERTDLFPPQVGK
ncbi:hypothetical protein TNIN_205451 [Trichonephila inaurata madagascariensis]|uniref:Uncharacterized protein n=1 Tax=Trichonephila inaurata madagascariensis TaxID=2747483 RepID=A0A8X6XRP3_9ARAC|nr:hypothetical protein TNIN_205451 [Trichonephila inaurata madagascariensis]